MSSSLTDDIDATDETRLRHWARENYVPLAERSLSWPLFVLDEMRRCDAADRSQAVKAPKLLLRVAIVPGHNLLQQ